MPAAKQKTYGLPALDTAPNPSDRLYEVVLASLGQGAWQRFSVVKGNAIAKETRLARGTVTRALMRLHSEGILEALRGKGYRIISVTPRQRATSVVSVTSFCEEERLEVVSVLDQESCSVWPLRQVPDAELGEVGLRDTIAEALAVDDSEPILVVRRARRLRRRSMKGLGSWAILETVFLVERKLKNLRRAFLDELSKLGSGAGAGSNLSLHRWMQANGIEPERSEYSLTIGPLAGRDRVAWGLLQPKASYPATSPFIRLRAVTYGKGRGPLLYTREHLVPELFDLGVTGFRFRPSGVLLPETEARSLGAQS